MSWGCGNTWANGTGHTSNNNNNNNNISRAPKVRFDMISCQIIKQFFMHFYEWSGGNVIIHILVHSHLKLSQC